MKPQPTTRSSIVITGVSSGIGYACVKTLSRHGYHLFGSVRQARDAERLSQEFGAGFTPLLFDVTDEAAVHAAAHNLRQLLAGRKLVALINNAGIAVPGPLLHLPIDEFRRQLEINVVGQLIVTQAFAPLLGTDRSLSGPPGKIINISSVSGKNAMPFVGAYSASKHALEAISESLRRELLIYGIDVIIVGPGAIATPIWEKAEAVDLSAYEPTDYGPFVEKIRKFMVQQGQRGLPADRLGELVLTILRSARPRTRYAIVPDQFKNWTLPRLLPKRLLDRVIARRLGFKA